MELWKRNLQGLVLGLFALGLTPLHAEQIGISGFKYLNKNDNSMTLDAEQAQDLLNVDIRPNGKSVKKREGYGLYKDLVTSQGVHGGHHFFDTSGNDVQIWGSSTSLFGIVGDGAATQLVSSATLNATWDCSDTQGYAYCVNSSRNVYLRTDGKTITWGTSPLGTMVESTPERVIVSGVSGAANSLYFSESGVFTNFTPGLSETSPFIEVIASPGAKITHVRYGCGKTLWWKDQSFGYLTGSDQFNITNTIVSDNIGTTDNASAIDPGGSVWFRGQDGHIWKYDCTALTKESLDITPVVSVTGRRTTNYWTQTTASDFNGGYVVPNGPSLSLDTSTVSGSILVRSTSIVDTSSDNFNSGSYTVGIDTYTQPGRIMLKNYVAETFNGSLGVFTDDTACAGDSAYASGAYYCAASGQTCCANSPALSISSDVVVQINVGEHNTGGDAVVALSSSPSNSWWQAGYNGSTTDVQLCKVNAYTISCSGGALLCTADVAGKINSDNTLGMIVYSTGTIAVTWNGTVACTATSLGNIPAFTYVSLINRDGGGTRNYIDNVYVGARTGVFTSRAFDTQLSTPTWGTMTTGYGTPSSSTTVSMDYSCSTSAVGGYTPRYTVGDSTAIAQCSHKRYLVWSSSLTTVNPMYIPTVSSVTVVAASTGTYYSAVKQATNLSAWDTFSAGQTLNDGTLTYYTRASTGAFTVTSSTPSWYAQTNGGVVAASTGTYMQTKIDFGISVATQSPTVNDFTFNWFDGTASDQSYATYFDNAIWFSVPYGSGQSTNNYIFKYDLINEGWTLYNFGAGGFATQNNRLYFGEVAGDQLFRYGGSTSDNGSAITAYWKSKDFPGSDPFLQNTYDQIDTLWVQDTNQSATVTYTLDTSSATAYTVNLSSPGYSIINHRKLLPGRLGYTANWKFGDESATSEWELLGFRFGLSGQPYRPTK